MVWLGAAVLFTLSNINQSKTIPARAFSGNAHGALVLYRAVVAIEQAMGP